MRNINSFSIFLILAACVLRAVSPSTALLSFVVLGVYSLFGPRQIIFAFAYTWLFVMANPGLVPDGNLVSSGKYIVFFFCAFSMFFRSSLMLWVKPGAVAKIRKSTIWVVFIVLLILLHSLLFSLYPILSMLKVLLWGVVLLTALGAWSSLSYGSSVQLRHDVFKFILAVFFISVPLVNSDVGYLENGSGFQGILNQPQVFGVTLSIACVMVFSYILDNIRNFTYWLIFISLIVFIILSEARVAGVSVVVSILVSLLCLLFKNFHRLKLHLKGLASRSTLVVTIFSVIVVSSNFSTLSSSVDDYFVKGGRDGEINNLADGFQESRGFLILKMMENVAERPLTGIGFGIGSNPEYMEIVSDPIVGVPISAPVEKGVLPLAILEELGIPLSVVIFVFLFLVLRQAFILGFGPLSLILLVYFVNMAEAMLFSPGGMGLLVLIVFSYVIAARKDSFPDKR